MSTQKESSRISTHTARWIAEARGGSRAALDQLLKTYCRYLLAVAKRELNAALRSRLDPVDVVQNTLMKAWRHFHRFQGQCEREWIAWLRQILRRNLANERRQHVHRAMRSTRREVPLIEVAVEHLPDSSRRDRASFGQHAQMGERHEQLADALRRLPAHYRQVLLLRTQEELTYPQIGERLQCTAEAARKLWKRATQHLAQRLGEKGRW